MSILSKLRGDDEQSEMTFIDHLEVLRWHIVRSVIAWLAAVIIIFINIDWVFDNIILAPLHKDFISYKGLCSLGQFINIGNALCMTPVDVKLQGNTISGPFMSAISIAMTGGLIFAFPYIFYEVWRFIKPALSAKELKYGKSSIFWVSLFMMMGASFGYFVLAPFTINFLANFNLGTKGSYIYMPTLSDYIGSITDIVLGCGVAFELPVIAFVLSKIGIINAKFLKKYRGYAFVAILVVAAILTPSPDWTSQLIVALPLFMLYELSIFVVKRNDKPSLADKTWE